MGKLDKELPLRLVVLGPPAGVLFALQRGKEDLVFPVMATKEDLSFDLVVRVSAKVEELPNFHGPFVQGPRGARFIYLNSGTLAGQTDSCWTRRAKIGLQAIGWDLVNRVLSEPSKVLEARIHGRARDGGPACASVPLLNGEWKISSALPESNLAHSSVANDG